MTNHGTSTSIESSPPPEVGPLATPPWASTPEAVLAAWDTTAQHGLSTEEARRRLDRYGENRLRRVRRRSGWRILWDQLASLIVGLLAVAAAVAFMVDERVEGFAIVSVIVLNAAVGFVTERRALRSMDALRELGHTHATVRRDASVHRIAASQLVPGDIVILDAGDVLTADVRLVAASRLHADESPLTGESMPVAKRVEAISVDAALGERTCMLFKGTAVTEGSGEAVVVATGMATELGHISALVDDAEPTTTPLEKRLDRLARRLIGLTLVIAAAVAVAVLMSGRGIYVAIELGIALAVATIPEGLPIVATVALARGMWRMARKNALVEQLAAVETLGSTTVILTDKTGTLTENQMTAVELRLADRRVEVTGAPAEEGGAFRAGAHALAPRRDALLLEALRIAVLCNNATLEASVGGARVTGDPTEVALLVMGAKAGLERRALLEEWPEVLEVAFDPDAKRMATLHAHDGAILVAVKGAPETVLAGCVAVRTSTGTDPLTPAGRDAWRAQADEMAASGQRVLALATARIDSPEALDFESLVLVGLVGLFDPPRERVRATMEACQSAGIRVAMVTGDHGATAWTVAHSVGLVSAAPPGPIAFVDARTLPPLDTLSRVDEARVLAAPIIARASPRQKLQLIELHQRNGEVVAMTGDGVNDAPALKKADIGIAMGLRGTQVAREAADMVLRDDELGTIVAAVAEGRAIFENVRKFVVYLMSCNVSEIAAVGLGALAGGPLPLLPLQILFLNLVTDVFPALALGVCEGSPALMARPPRDPRVPMLTRSHWRHIFGHGLVIALSVLAALGIAVHWLDTSPREATTISFATLALAQLWHVFSMRDRGSGWLRNEVTQNSSVWSALALCVVLLLAAVYWPPLSAVLSTAPLGPAEWSLAILLSLVPLAVGQLTLHRGGSDDMSPQ